MSSLAVCPDLTDVDRRDSYAESIATESDIYEDPAITHEGVIPNLDPLDLTNYLVSSSHIDILHHRVIGKK